MEDTFKVEGIIWKVTEGETTEVKISDDIFVKKSSLDKTSLIKQPMDLDKTSLIEQPIDIDHNKEIPFDKHEDIDRGESIGNNIHRNVLHAVIQAVKEGKKQDDIKQIISKYHPNILKESLTAYTSNYKKYIIKHYPELKSKLSSKKFKKKFKKKIRQLEDKRGKIIAILGHNTIFEWPLRAFKKALKEERDRSYLEEIIKFYHDTNNESSIDTYISCYKRYINKTYGEHTLKEVNVFDESEDLYKLLPPLEIH